MTLANLWILHFLWLVPLAAVALVIHGRQKRRALERFADPEFLDRLTGKDRGGRRFLKGFLLLTSLSLMLFALAGPRWGSHYQEVRQKGVDIMILVDVSPSMLVEDMEPNRLEQARREILDFLRVVQGDRVGLVAFSGAAFVQCPLTLDYGALQMFLNSLQPDLVPVAGTDLGAAIETGLSSFDFNSQTDKVILLITDGEDNEGRGLDAARKAAAKGVKVFIFGMGEASGGPIPADDGKGGFKKDVEGRLILSKLDEESLRKIATLTGGGYVRSVAGDLDLDLIYFQGIKSRTEAQTLKSGKIKVYEERFTMFVLAALLLLILEDLISERGVRSVERGSPLTSGLRMLPMVLVLSGLVLASRALAAENPDELYRLGRFAEAEKGYARLDMDHPKDVRYRYNRGCAAYQNSDLQGASAAFSSALRRAADDELRFKAAFNLGNIAYQQGDFESAAAHFKQAVVYNPSSEDARYNLELALRELERQKKDASEGAEAEQPKGVGEPEDGQGAQKQGAQKTGQEEAGSDPRSPQEKPTEAESSQAQDHPEPGQGEEAKEGDDSRSAAGQDDRQDSPGDLSGELEALHGLPEDQGEEQTAALAPIDRKKAEALLDNIREDRSRFLRFQVPKEKRYGVQSGKEW